MSTTLLPFASTKPQSKQKQKELLRRVVALSYTGDVRMGLAEDERKVERIVAGGGGGRLRDAYAALLKEVRVRWFLCLHRSTRSRLTDDVRTLISKQTVRTLISKQTNHKKPQGRRVVGAAAARRRLARRRRRRRR